MPRYRLLIEYDGTPFQGWQRQAGDATIQARIETAITRFCGEHVRLFGAGRTDAGVHAAGQVAHVDLQCAATPHTLREAVNFHLRPCPIAILEAALVPEDFHARFSATGRSYEYRIVNRRAPLALERGRAWHVIQPLDVEAMQAGARTLIGRHDFTTFRHVHCQAPSPIRTLRRLDALREGERVVIRAEARSFLHSQVRSLVGSLKLVGIGKWSPDDLRAALEARDRSACGPVAPAHGLCLMRVDYASGGLGREAEERDDETADEE